MAKVKKGQPTLRVLTEQEISKKYSEVARCAYHDPTPQLFLPSRSLALNHQLGGGAPYGRIVEIIGFESTGKTLMANDFAYVAQSMGGVVLWDDAEGTWSNHWAKANGIDPSKVFLYEENDVEGFSDWARDLILYWRSKLTNNEPILLVVDSIAAWECDENIDSDQKGGKAEMGNRAKAIYKMYRKRNKYFKKYGVVCLMINQVRDKVGASIFEAAETTPGGGATKFYATIRLMLRRSKQIKNDDDEKVGQNIIIQVVKNKISPPRESLKTGVYFVDTYKGYYGYDRYIGLPEVLVKEKIVKKKGSRYYYKENMVANGEDNFLELLATDDDLRRKLIKKSSINTASKLRDELSNIKKNLFPVKLKAKKSKEKSDEETE